MQPGSERPAAAAQAALVPQMDEAQAQQYFQIQQAVLSYRSRWEERARKGEKLTLPTGESLVRHNAILTNVSLRDALKNPHIQRMIAAASKK